MTHASDLCHTMGERPHTLTGFRSLSSFGSEPMRLSLHILGTEVLAISTDPEPDEDTARDLSGGNLGSDRIEAGATDTFMGFTNGRAVDDDD